MRVGERERERERGRGSESESESESERESERASERVSESESSQCPVADVAAGRMHVHGSLCISTLAGVLLHC